MVEPEKASPQGLFNCAEAGAPSENPAVPEPLVVVTTCVEGTTLRRRWFSLSPTKRFSVLSSAKPVGALKEAPSPIPSAQVPVPLPARVLTMHPPMVGEGVSVGETDEEALGASVGVEVGVAPMERLGVGLGVALRVAQV